MRLLCEIFVIGLLLSFGWEKSFHQRVVELQDHARTKTQKEPASAGESKPVTGPHQPFNPIASVRRALDKESAAARSQDWSLDSMNAATSRSLPSPTPVLARPDGRRFWIDTHGMRHELPRTSPSP